MKPAAPIKVPRINARVLVLWQDPTELGGTEWRTVAESHEAYKAAETIVETLGHLTHRDKESIGVSRCIGRQGGRVELVGVEIKIPITAILSIREVKPV